MLGTELTTLSERATGVFNCAADAADGVAGHGTSGLQACCQVSGGGILYVVHDERHRGYGAVRTCRVCVYGGNAMMVGFRYERMRSSFVV